VENLINNYYLGKTIKQLAKENNTNYSSVRRFLLKNDIKLRNQGRTGAYIQPSEEAKQIILGTLLGDGSFAKGRKTPCLIISHGGRQEEYLQWKVNKIDGLEGKIYKRIRYDKRTLKNYVSVEYHSRTHPYIEYLKNIFIKDGKKNVNIEILLSLNELGITVWYCDDGSIYHNKDTNHLTLAVNGFTDLERLVIIKFFRDNYGLNFRLSQKQIRLVSLKEISMFMNLFGRYIPNCMEYKKGRFK